MSASSWWDKSTGFALLTILLWASLAALTSRITSVSPLVLVGLVLFFCGAGALPFWRQWRASPLTWLAMAAARMCRLRASKSAAKLPCQGPNWHHGPIPGFVGAFLHSFFIAKP